MISLVIINLKEAFSYCCIILVSRSFNLPFPGQLFLTFSISLVAQNPASIQLRKQKQSEENVHKLP